MLDAGTLRFTDAPDTRAEIEHGARDSKSPKPTRKNDATSEKKSELLQKPPLILGDDTASPDDSSRLRLSLTTPDAAPEPATNVRTLVGDAHVRRSSQSMWDARGVEDAFDDSEENATTTTTARLNSSAEDEYSVEKYSKDSAVLTASGTASETTEEADGANVSNETRFVTRDLVTRDLSSLREWTRELRNYQRAFAEDGVNDDAAEKKAGAFLREHLARADAVVDEIVKRRDALAKQTRDAMREGLSSDASMTILNGTAHDPNATLHTRKSRLLRKLQLFDAEAFAALSDVAEAQTRRFFEPLREVSGSMFARFLKSKFSGPGCSEDRAVDFAAIGRAGARLERRAGAGSGTSSGLGFGRVLCVNAVGSAGAFGAAAKRKNTERDDEAMRLATDPDDGVFRRDGGKKETRGGGGSGWTEFGVARRSRRAVNASGARGPIARPEVDDGLAHARKEADVREARARARRLATSLKASGARDFLRDGGVVFDSSSFARTVESVFDVASLVAGGEASLEVNEAGDDLRVRAVDPNAGTHDAHETTHGVARRDDDENRGAFVLRLDLATWRAMGGCSDSGDARAEKKRTNASRVKKTRVDDGNGVDDDEDDTYGFGFGFDDDDDFPDAYDDDVDDDVDASGEDDAVKKKRKRVSFEPACLFSDGVRMRGIMPLGADPFEALLDDDFDAARRAHHSLNLAPREGAIVAGMAYVYREGFMDETFFRNWASDMLVTFYHFSLAATEGGPAHALATRAVWRVARAWLESNSEMPAGSTSEDVLFFNEGCYVLKQLGIPHDRLARQLETHMARFESRDYFRGLDLAKPDSYRVKLESVKETAPPVNGEDTKDEVLDEAANMSQDLLPPKKSGAKKKGSSGSKKAIAKKGIARNTLVSRPRRLLDVGDGDVKKFNTALIWSFFFKESGAEEKTFMTDAGEETQGAVHEPLWRGDKADAIRAAADAEVDLRHALSLHPDDARAALDFDDVCYFVTHKIFVATNWGLKRLRKEEWIHERAFLKTHLPYAMTGAKHGYGDVHLVGEFVQCLRCFDDVARVDPDVAEATRWMCSRQNKATGGWEVLDADFKNSYHATICALGALLTPKMRGVAEKAKKALYEDFSISSNRWKTKARESAAETTALRRSARSVEKVSVTEAETRERRAAWDAARTRPWETAKRRKRF